jgi:Domain of unknown function (DUF4377)
MRSSLTLTTLSKWAFALMAVALSNASFAQACTREYAPVCGQLAHEKSPTTFSNRCILDSTGARQISKGECGSTPQTPPEKRPGSDVDAHGCKPSTGHVWNADLASCVRPWVTRVVMMEVARHRRKCIGVIETECLMVREVEPGKRKPKWVPFFGKIDGFTHQAGTRYLLSVRQDKLDNVPADAPDTSYKLIKVLR